MEVPYLVGLHGPLGVVHALEDRTYFPILLAVPIVQRRMESELSRPIIDPSPDLVWEEVKLLMPRPNPSELARLISEGPALGATRYQDIVHRQQPVPTAFCSYRLLPQFNRALPRFISRLRGPRVSYVLEPQKKNPQDYSLENRIAFRLDHALPLLCALSVRDRAILPQRGEPALGSGLGPG